MGWGDLVNGGLDVVVLPVNPHAMLVEPFVRHLQTPCGADWTMFRSLPQRHYRSLLLCDFDLAVRSQRNSMRSCTELVKATP